MDRYIGYFAIFLGVLWAVWPQLLRGWLVGKASWTLYGMLVFYLFFPVAAIAEQWGAKGWIALGVGLIVLGGLLRGLIGKGAERVPTPAFRIVGLLNIFSGVYLAFIKK